MEVLVHLAKDRYNVPSKAPKDPLKQQGETLVTAVHKVIKESLRPFFCQFESQHFREYKLWNQYCDDILKYNLTVLRDIYSSYSGKFATPGDRNRFMSCIEFV